MNDICIPLENFIKTLNVIADFQDVDTKDHTRRCRDIADKIANEFDFTEEQREFICYGADIHDIGKIGIEPYMLRQATRLTKSQYASIRKHPEFGAEIIRFAGFPQMIVDCVLYHHEHRDGSGYPFGLKGDQIPLHSAIVCIADVWEAINSHRSYRPAFKREDAIALMAKHSTWFNLEVYTKFVMLVQKGVL